MYGAARLLVVDPESERRVALRQLLQGHGHDVVATDHGDRGLELARGDAFQLVITQIPLSAGAGSGFCKALREQGLSTLLLVLSGDPGEAARLDALASGADDFVAHPFSPKLLLARVAALLRRGGGEHSSDPGVPPAEDRIELGDLVVNLSCFVACFEGEDLLLTVTELRLLHHLLLHPRITLRRGELMVDVLGYRAGVSSRTMDTHVLNLRRKLRSPRIPVQIETVRGMGYRLLTR